MKLNDTGQPVSVILRSNKTQSVSVFTTSFGTNIQTLPAFTVIIYLHLHLHLLLLSCPVSQPAPPAPAPAPAVVYISAIPVLPGEWWQFPAVAACC